MQRANVPNHAPAPQIKNKDEKPPKIRYSIRISNLSYSTVNADVSELVKPFGPIQKLNLAKDKKTGICKGFAFVHFRFEAGAEMAIDALDGLELGELTLKVEWSEPKQYRHPLETYV